MLTIILSILGGAAALYVVQRMTATAKPGTVAETIGRVITPQGGGGAGPARRV